MARSEINRSARLRRRRGIMITLVLGIVSCAVFFVLLALRASITYFYTPADLAQKNLPPEETIRLGGVVSDGSMRHDKATVHFDVTDFQNSCHVTFNGDLPDLFREGQGVVVEGKFYPGVSKSSVGRVHATQVLAKHDETYMPPEVATALKKRGVWRTPGSLEHSGDSSMPIQQLPSLREPRG